MDGIFPQRANYYPVLGQLMNEMDLAGMINRVIDIPDSQANIDVGTFVCLFIHHILADVNVKMYKMDDFFIDKAMPLLVPWKPDLDVNEINDDRAARVLDSIWEANPQRVFSAMVDAAIPLHSLKTNEIHLTQPLNRFMVHMILTQIPRMYQISRMDTQKITVQI